MVQPAHTSLAWITKIYKPGFNRDWAQREGSLRISAGVLLMSMLQMSCPLLAGISRVRG